MDISQALDEINRCFYERFAPGFHQSREHGWTGWRTLLDHLPDAPLSILDIGCGNGRLAKFLDKAWCAERGGQILDFHGLDQCGPLLSFAEAESYSFPTRWSPWSWTEILGTEQASDNDPFAGDNGAMAPNWVTLFGVMHHIFGYERRLALLLRAANCLRVGGTLTVSLWDFGAHEKWQKKLLPWADFTERFGIDPNLLEEGDHLLGWSGHRDTPRYCHWVSREEERRMVADVQALSTVELSAGERIGDDEDLNRYWCWRRIAD